MKKINNLIKVMILWLVICVPSSRLFAQDADAEIEPRGFKYDFDIIFHFKYPVKMFDSALTGFANFITAFRGSMDANLYYHDNSHFFGAILGFSAIPFQSIEEGNENSLSLIDIHLLLSYRYKSGFFTISPYAGLYVNIVPTSEDNPVYYSATVGVKLGLGSFLLTFDYQRNFGNQDDEQLLCLTGEDVYRFGIGWRVDLAGLLKYYDEE